MCVGTDGAIPEMGGFLAVFDDVAEAVDFDFGIAVPGGLLVGG